jgi:integrase/recombinase XerD
MARAKQYADRVNIIKRIKLGSKWPFASIVEHNGRIVRDHVWVAGQEEHHWLSTLRQSGVKVPSPTTTV